MKKAIIFFIASIFFIANHVDAQQMSYSDDDVEIQLVKLIGDSTTGILTPVLRFKPKDNEKRYLAIKHPRAWDDRGQMYESKDQYYSFGTNAKDPIYLFNGDNEVWTKTNCDEYFRLEGWNNRNNTVSVVAINYLCDAEWIEAKMEYKNAYKMMVFYDVPITWETPTDLPTATAKKFGIKPLRNNIGVYHPYKNNEKAFDGSIRLESVFGNVKTGELRFLMQVKSNGATRLRSDEITIKYKGEIITFKGKNYNDYTITPNKWTEVTITASGNGVFVHPDTKYLEYIDIEIGGWPSLGNYIVKGKVPIHWMTFTTPTSSTKKGGK